jgi:phosphoglycerate dehydrogenase-like enzyme
MARKVAPEQRPAEARMSLKVHLLHPPAEEALALLEAGLDETVVLSCGPERPEPATYEVLVAGRPAAEDLAASPALHTLIIPWSGLPVQTRELLQDFPSIAVHNLHHNAAPVAELAVALLLSAAKFLIPFDRALRQGDWTPRYRPTPAALLEGKTALVLGYGAIGRRVARVCQALAMEVVATRRSLVEPVREEGVAIYPAGALLELLPRADVLFITLPLTPATEGLIGAVELSALPAEAVLVNVGRGAVVDQEALFRALNSGRLRAAGLDVWYNYPPDETSRTETPPADYPFHELENVVLSPHRGGSTDETARLRMTHLAHMLNRAARSEALPNRVDVDTGY